MRENLAKRKLKAGNPILMLFFTSCDPALAEVVARSGIDLIVIDNEHSALDDRDIVNVARAVELHGATCLLRTPVKDFDTLARYMDFGLSGICATQCNSLSEARAVVDAVKYAPAGRRGIGQLSRACGQGFYDGRSLEEVMHFSNENTMIITTIESVDGIREADQIAALPEVDSVHLGPLDLSISMGIGGNPSHPDVVNAINSTNERILAAGNTIGDFVPSPERIPALIEAGFSVLLLGSECDLMKNVYSGYCASLRSVMYNRKMNRS